MLTLVHIWKVKMLMLVHIWKVKMLTLVHIWKVKMLTLVQIWKVNMLTLVHIWKVNMLTLVHKDANLQTLMSMDTVVHRKKSVLAASKLPAVFLCRICGLDCTEELPLFHNTA